MSKSGNGLLNKSEKKIERVIVEIYPDTNLCNVFSGNGDPWSDMATLLEGLSLVCQKCIDNGMSTEKVYGEVQNYFMKIMAAGGYKLIKTVKL